MKQLSTMQHPSPSLRVYYARDINQVQPDKFDIIVTIPLPLSEFLMLHSKLHPIVSRICIKEILFRMPFYIQTAFKINICGQTERGHFIDLCSTQIYFAFCEIHTASRFIGLGLVDPFNFANFMMMVFYPRFYRNYIFALNIPTLTNYSNLFGLNQSIKVAKMCVS